MTPETRDQIAQAICGATEAGRLFPWPTLSEGDRDVWRGIADAAVAAQRQACHIHSLAQLDELPVDSAVIDNHDDICIKSYGDSDGWTCSGTRMLIEHVALPARLIWHPDWSQS